jgi:hypothetical protein
MAARAERRTLDEVYEHLVQKLNGTILRPGMSGGIGQGPEFVLWHELHDLAFIDNREEELTAMLQRLNKRGVSGSTGVHGKLWEVIGENRPWHSEALALVYAEVAHHFGWLRPNRVLRQAEYDALRSQAKAWTSEADRTIDDLVDMFGKPSVWLERQHRSDTSFGYCTANLDDPVVVFDFWRLTWTPDAWTPPDEHILLRDVRWTGESTFEDDFTFSPNWLRHVDERSTS